MPRPRCCRRMGARPQITFYKPQGVPLAQLQIVELAHEEWEALRLHDVEKLDQIEAADKMETSRSTTQRLLASVRHKLATAIVTGQAIKIIPQDS